MGIFDFRKKIKQVPQPEERHFFNADGLFFNGYSSYSSTKSMQLSTVYAAVNQISNSVAMLTMDVTKTKNDVTKTVQHNLTNLLNMRPDRRCTRFNFFKKLIESVILRGNGYAYIERDQQTLEVKNLRYIDSDFVTPMITADGSVKYIVHGMSEAVDAVNMIHLYMHCDDQMNGISVLKYAIETLENAADTEKHSGNFFRSGANLSGVLTTNTPLDADKRDQLRSIWTGAFRHNKQEVSVAVLPQGVDFKPISVDPETACLLDSRKYNVLEICRFLNISPFKVFQFDSMTYSSLEMAQISYLEDTVRPYTEMIMNEFNLKLFRPSEIGKLKVKYNYDDMLITNKQSEAEYYRTLITNGIMSVNEVRVKLGYSPIENEAADKYYLQMSYSTLDNIASGALIKGNQSQDQSQAVDNKYKEKKEE